MVSRKKNNIRIQIAQESARIIAESGVKDYLIAKKKAAGLLGCQDKSLLPSNQEIETALRDYQTLFNSNALTLNQQREAAIEAMRFLNQFKPRLVGRVLNGTAMSHSSVILHVFADTPEEVMVHLLDNGIPFENDFKQLRFKQSDYVDFPVYAFEAGEIAIKIVVLPVKGLRESPLSPVDGKPMERADASAVEALLAVASYEENGTGL